MAETLWKMADLAPLFAEAARTGAWFHCTYQNLWFAPEELRAEQAAGRFRWGPGNWKLRDPQERVAELLAKIDEALAARKAFEARVAKSRQARLAQVKVREAGFYWVKFRSRGSEWTVGAWNARHGVWTFAGNEEDFLEGDVAEVGPRITLSREA